MSSPVVHSKNPNLLFWVKPVYSGCISGKNDPGPYQDAVAFACRRILEDPAVVNGYWPSVSNSADILKPDGPVCKHFGSDMKQSEAGIWCGPLKVKGMPGGQTEILAAITGYEQREVLPRQLVEVTITAPAMKGPKREAKEEVPQLKLNDRMKRSPSVKSFKSCSTDAPSSAAPRSARDSLELSTRSWEQSETVAPPALASKDIVPTAASLMPPQPRRPQSFPAGVSGPARAPAGYLAASALGAPFNHGAPASFSTRPYAPVSPMQPCYVSPAGAMHNPYFATSSPASYLQQCSFAVVNAS